MKLAPAVTFVALCSLALAACLQGGAPLSPPASTAEDAGLQDDAPEAADSVVTLDSSPSAADVGPDVIEEPAPELLDLAALVDPFLGTDGPGNVIPGALVPHGMIRASPDTESGFGSIDAYEHGDPRIEGFTHTHLEGPGGSQNGYSQLLLMPTTGPLEAALADLPSTFSSDTEEASPGYYAVTLEDYQVRVELTAAARAAVHRYTFLEAADAARLHLDLAHCNGAGIEAHAEVDDAHRIEGWATYELHPVLSLVLEGTGLTTLYFVLELDAPIAAHGFTGGTPDDPAGDAATGAGLGVWLDLGAAQAGDVREARVGISWIDEAQARANLDADVTGLTFDEVRAAARAAWNQRLHRVVVEGGTEEQRTSFYTALYHSMFQPADHTEAGGRFHSAADGPGEVFEDAAHRFYTDDWCMWDTFRTSHPLATLLEPETRADVMASMLHLYEQGGWLPKCTWHASGYSRVMTGHHAVSILADTAVKGVGDLDLELAFAAAWKHAVSDVPDDPGADGLCGYFNLGTVPSYLDLGYVPHECDATQAASMTLEYAYDDWCIAQLADLAGYPNQRDDLLARSASWKHHLNPAHGFMQGRWADGSWVEPFDPADGSDANSFVEATSWIFTFSVPHDVPGLVDALGGAEAFVARLDAYFAEGHHDMSNQPGFHIPFLYNRAGAPAKAQERVRQLVSEHFGAGRDGLPGNDDAGSTSAWLVWAAMGLYPINPGEPRYEIVTPLFARAEILLDAAYYPGGVFLVETVGSPALLPYVQAATLDGEPLDRAWLSHAEIAAGGTLELTLGEEPSSWGADR